MPLYILLVSRMGIVDDSRKYLRFVNIFSDIVKIVVMHLWFFPEMVFYVKFGVCVLDLLCYLAIDF